jgi:hypothetical protein
MLFDLEQITKVLIPYRVLLAFRRKVWWWGGITKKCFNPLQGFISVSTLNSSFPRRTSAQVLIPYRVLLAFRLIIRHFQ